MNFTIIGSDKLKKLVLNNRSLLEDQAENIHDLLRKNNFFLCESVRYKLYDHVYKILDDNE